MMSDDPLNPAESLTGASTESEIISTGLDGSTGSSGIAAGT